jgi:hypothetical protein
VAGRGRRTAPQRFVLEIDTIARISHFTMAIDFEEGGLMGRVSERAGLIRDRAITGRAKR